VSVITSKKKNGGSIHRLGNREGLLGRQLHGLPLKIDRETALDDVEELVFLRIRMPSVFFIRKPDLNYGIIHSTHGAGAPLSINNSKTTFHERFPH
jgi:hypothetical protein